MDIAEEKKETSKHHQPDGSHFSIEPLVLFEHGLLCGFGSLLLAADFLIQPFVFRLEASQQFFLFLAFLFQSCHKLLCRCLTAAAANITTSCDPCLTLQVFQLQQKCKHMEANHQRDKNLGVTGEKKIIALFGVSFSLEKMRMHIDLCRPTTYKHEENKEREKEADEIGNE